MDSTKKYTENDDVVYFLEDPSAEVPSGNPWRILAVDDDHDFQAALAFSLRNCLILNRSIELIQAYSMAEAVKVLAHTSDIAVVLVDVVMETDDAGLQLTKAIRSMLGYYDTRIVLLTGQPGFAPIDSVMSQYDLSEYCLKSDINHRGIKSILTGVLRSYRDLSAVSYARRTLNLILETSNRIVGKRSHTEIANIVLNDIAKILGLPPEGVFCVHHDQSEPVSLDTIVVVGTSGRTAIPLHTPLASIANETLKLIICQAMSEKRHINFEEGKVFYFPPHLSVKAYAAYVACKRPLEQNEFELLKIFIETASRGFGNANLLDNLEKLAYYDATLNIPNRNALRRQIERVRDCSGDSDINLLKLDIDNFGGITATFGLDHAMHFLSVIRDLLVNTFPAPHFIARAAPDIFFILGLADLVTIETVKSLFDQPINVDGNDYRVTACYALVPLKAVLGPPEKVLGALGATMRAAKAIGPGSNAVYEPAFEDRSKRRFDISSKLSLARRNRELFTLIQPQFDMRNRAAIGGEVLLRWQRDEKLIPPNEFIPIAEQSTLIHDIGRFVLDQTLDALNDPKLKASSPIVLGLNVSPRELLDETFIDNFLSACEKKGVDPARLELEVTESTVMQNFDTACAQLKRFRAAGGRVAIDDFGTGMSSLAYLMELPYDRIKIDRSFIQRLFNNAASKHMVSTYSLDGKAAVRCILCLKGRLPTNCCQTRPDSRTAG